MTLDDIAALDRTLQAAGQQLSQRKVAAFFHIGHTAAARLLHQYRDQQAAAPAPVLYPEQPCTLVAEVAPAPLPLLVQAEQRVIQSRQAEHAAYRAWDLNRSDASLSSQLREAQSAHRKAQGWL